MTLLKWASALVFLLSNPSFAREMLPVALGQQSAGFYLGDNKPPLPLGAQVEFLYKDEKGIPRKLPGVTGFVLGERDNVIFFELSERDAIHLAKRRATSTVSFQKIQDPMPEAVKVRREYRDSGHAVRLAPLMRRLTVKMEVDPETAAAWSPGETLTFINAGQFRWNKKYYDVEAMFRSAKDTEDGQFEVTIVADPHSVNHILRAELEGRLTVDPEAEATTKASSAKRCFVTRRSGDERIQVEIPCTN